MRKRIAIFSIVLILCASICLNFGGVASSSYAMENKQLKFGENKQFKILILSDYQETDSPFADSDKLVSAALEKTQPDLVVLLGDNTGGWWKNVDEERTFASLKNLVTPIQEKNIPFALVFGNHDEEGGVSKERLMELYNTFDCCMAIEGENLTGVGNYNLLIKDSENEKDVFNLYFMDSNDYAKEGGYGYVADDQIAWYEKTADKLKSENGGNVLPSLLFQHITVPEIYNLLTEVEKDTKNAIKGQGDFSDKYFVANDKLIDQGELREGPCPPNINNGQFDSWVKKGDVLGAFFGHDHVNDFSGVLDGIRLTQSLACGFCNYGDVHGVRTITLFEDDLENFKTETITYEEIVGEKPSNFLVAKFGFHTYKKMILPVIIFVPVIGILVVGGILLRKKRRGRK